MFSTVLVSSPSYFKFELVFSNFIFKLDYSQEIKCTKIIIALLNLLLLFSYFYF